MRELLPDQVTVVPSFSRYPLSTYCVSGSLIGAGNMH